MNSNQLKQLSLVYLVLGFASIVGSIAIWYLTGGKALEAQAHGERFGIFVGLWAPTFMSIGNGIDNLPEGK